MPKSPEHEGKSSPEHGESGAEHGGGGPLCMPETSRKQALRRLAIARGQLENIQRMLEQPHTYCVDVLLQLKAVQGALDGVGQVVLRGHLESHVATAAHRGDASELVDELMDVFKMTR
jgi:CsoR family transcriptional regulator, copper-sensing transcriptional repressor